MMVHVFVEGPTERLTLPKVLADVFATGRVRSPIPLRGSRFFNEIGPQAAAILALRSDAHVFACPDLAPRASAPWAYEDYRGLQDALQLAARRAREEQVSRRRASSAMKRFHPHPFRHDFEVLLLALPERLKAYLGTTSRIEKHYNARQPEEQDFDRYPKRVVEQLFRKFAKRDYNDVTDCPRFFEGTTAELVQGIETACPRFADFVGALRGAVAAP